MLMNLLLLVIGVIIGTLGTLIGVGGGFILMPILLFLYQNDSPETLTSITLTATFVNSLSGTIAYARMKKINFKYGLIFAAFSIPGAVIGAYLTQFVDRDIFSLIFAILLISVSVLIFIRTKPDTNVIESHEISLSWRKLTAGILISIFVGMLSSFLGIGGGIIHVPVLSNVFSFPVHIATATSHFILSITSFAGLMVHIVTGKYHHGILRAAFISGGALIGAQLGAMLSSKIKGKIIIRILAIALFFMGARLIFLFFAG